MISDITTISAFDTFFQLFAGATLACAGIIPLAESYIKLRLLNNFNKNEKIINEKCLPNIRRIQENIEFLQSAINNNKKFPKILTEKIHEEISISKQNINWFTRQEEKFNIDLEVNRAQRSAYNLCGYSFLFSISLLILSSFTEIGQVSDYNSMRLLAHYHLINVPILIFSTLTINKKGLKKYSSFSIAFICFLIAILISVLMSTFVTQNYFPLHYNAIIIVALFTSAFPFIAIVARILVISHIRFYYFNARLPEALKRINENDVITEIRNFVDNPTQNEE